ncbi:bZIP transcription factor [Lachnoclostridium phytofermentans]|uniref:bZIP transcription factor n=1 Tax=Lachnoclostridium phytofermentans TaxID=66219 RepID=UPI0004957144|nr:bZIP transcription factor [Lachnoclostridium phytofermentans]
MFILVDQANVLQYILTVLEETVDPSGLDVYRISENLFCIKKGIRAFEVNEIVEDIVPYKYCYTIEKGFYLNPNWKEPQKSLEDQLVDLRDENQMLKSELSLLQEVVNEMLLGV